MLAVSGIVFIPQESKIEHQKTKFGHYLTFNAVSKHPTQDRRVPSRVNIFIPEESINKAMELIKPGEMICIRHGDLDGRQPEGSTTIFSQVKTTWKNIEFLTRLPKKEKQ